MKSKKILLCFLLMIFSFCFVSCNNKKKTDTPQTPVVNPQASVVNPTFSLGPYYVGDQLSTISIYTSAGDTAGTIKWAKKDYVLVLGENSCGWIFTPTDTSAFLSKTGVQKIIAVNPKQAPTISNVRIAEGKIAYNEALYSTISLECDSNVEGTISLTSPNEVFHTGENICAWEFVPTDSENYKNVTGNVTIVVTQNQQVKSISVKSNTKTSGFVAYDQYDLSGLVLNIEYNAGKIETKNNSNSDFSVTYNLGECLHAGDTSVTVNYCGKSCSVAIDAVAKKGIAKPEFTDILTYNGEQQSLSIAESSNYNFEALSKTDAGTYDLDVTLADVLNCKWIGEEDSLQTIKVTCYILTAAQEIAPHCYQAEYDGGLHGASITSENAANIYYSTNELNGQNYKTAGTLLELAPYKDAGNYTIYYYAVGDKNHSDAKGSLSVEILKQTPIVSCEYCYSVKTGSPINYPASLVSVKDKQNNNLEIGTLTFTYYSSYTNDQDSSNDVKTNAAGSAPTNDMTTPYYVVVEYAGDEGNFASSTGVAELFIDKVDNGFYDSTGSAAFAFKDDVYVASSAGKPFTLTGSNQLCDCYLEFSPCEVDQDGLKQISYTSRFGSSDDSVKTGKLIYKNGHYQMIETGTNLVSVLSLGTNVSTISLSINNNLTTLNKWEIPNYLGTYSAQTVEETELRSAHTSQNTTINIYNDYGTIRFVVNYNVPFDNGFIPSGGSGTWSGVVVSQISTDADNNDENCYWLDCYETSGNNYTTDFSDECFALKWSVSITNPTALNLAEWGGLSSSYLVDPFDVLIKTYTKAQ